MIDILNRNKNITLLRPYNTSNREEPPLGIGYVAGYLEKTEFKGMINIIDCEAEDIDSDEKIVDALNSKKTSILGISFFTYDRFAAKKVATLAQKMGIITVAGGVHVSTDALGTMRQCPEFDYAVIAEGEHTFYELLKCILENKKPERVLGVAWRDGDKIIINPRRPLIKDLDALPYPAYHLLPMQLYESHSVIGSRGCPNVCKFCASPYFWQRKLRFRSPKNLLDEVSFLLKNFGDKSIRFKDDTFTFKTSWAIGVCKEIIDRGLEIKWDLLARATGLKEEVLIAARKAGAYKIRIGIESGNEDVRKLINKKLDNGDIYRAVALARKTGFKSIGTFFMIGLPGEKEAEIEQTYNMVKELDADYVSFKPADIYPNTGLYDMAVEKNLLPDPFPWFDLSTIEKYPKGFLVYEGIPTYTEYFTREKIQKLSSALYTKYFTEKLFRISSKPKEIFFHEMGFMGIFHYKPLNAIYKVFDGYFESKDKIRRRKGLYFLLKLIKEKLKNMDSLFLRLKKRCLYYLSTKDNKPIRFYKKA